MTLAFVDPELGPMRWCGRCEEAWPDDEEFWAYYTVPAGTPTGTGYVRRKPVEVFRCRACYSEKDRLRHQADKARRVILGPVPCFEGCGQMVFFGTPIAAIHDLRQQAWRTLSGFVHRCSAAA